MLKKKRFWFLIIYVALMAASYAVRLKSVPPGPANGKKFETIQIDAGETVKMAYKETGALSNQNKLPVILVHGSPGSAEAFDGLTALLPGRKIIAIDLPGFGDSQKNISDYSILAHAKYLNAFLKKKGIARAHLAGFSLGGGVILEAERLNPGLAASETLISSIGVQEYELFGSYRLNHAVHGLQLAFFWSVRNLTPHFGMFESGLTEYSRNFYDTDQRPLREILAANEKPFLIVHGKDDPLVPVEAAREHARLVPQSEYHEIDDNHFYIFMRPEKVAGILKTFWENVENGTAITRQKALPARIAAARQPFVYEIMPAKGPAVFCFFLFLFAVAIINEDFASLLAGVFVAQGRFGFGLGLIAIVMAIGLSSLFWRRIGRRKMGHEQGFIPSSLEKQSSGLFGFRFQAYMSRSRDPFVRFFFGSIGFGVLRALIVGLASYALTRAVVMGGVVDNTSTFILASGLLFLYLMIAVVRWRVIDH